MVTVAKASAGLAWCVNPCQIIYERRSTALRFSAPPGVNRHRSPSPEEEGTSRNRGETPKRTAKGVSGGEADRLWAGKSPSSAPKWAAFLPGFTHKGRQSAVAYATKEGHLIEVSYLTVDGQFRSGRYFRLVYVRRCSCCYVSVSRLVTPLWRDG